MSGCYCNGSADPIAIDLDGDGFALTGLRGGVKFDFFATGKPIQMSWTAAASDVAWLVLDLNGNGRIDNGTELFSNAAPQPEAKGRLGFRALAVYDQPASGGNRDGWIDEKDGIYSRLRLWVDKNHNGISEPSELFTLKQVGVKAISVHYQDSKWQDAYGNQFRYRSPVVRDTGPGIGQGQWAYDVILVSQNGK